MAATAESVVVEVLARTDGFTSAMTRAAETTATSGARIKSATEASANAVEASMMRTANASNTAGASQMILQSVIRRTTDQFAAGAPLATIFAEHIGALAEAGELAGGAMGSFGALLAGPWGIAISAAASVLGILGGKLLESGDAADSAEKSLKAFEDRQDDMGRFISSNTGLLVEQNRQLALIASMQLPAQIRSQGGVAQGFVNDAFGAAKGALSGMPGSDLLGRIQLKKAIDDAGGNVQDLRRNIATVAADHPVFADLSNQVAGLAGQAAEAALKIGTLQGHQRDLNTVLQGGVVVTTSLIDRQVAAATATDGVARAQARLNNVRAMAASIDAMDSGPAKTKALAQYKADLAAAETGVKSEQAAEERRQAAQRLRDLADYVETVRKLGSEEGLVPDLIRDSEQLRRKGGLASADEETKGITDQIGKVRDTTILDPKKEELEQQRRAQEASIRTLSGLYYDLFSGGTKSLWKDFERMGLEALAKLAAQKTFELVLRVASGGGLGGEIGSLLGIAPRASGGPVALGRTYLVGEKGPELFSPHTSGTIVPNHAIPQALPNVAPMMDMRAATPQVVSNRVFNINVSADHSVTPARFAGDLAQQILERAAQMDAQTLALGQRITPGMLRQAQVMKG